MKRLISSVTLLMLLSCLTPRPASAQGQGAFLGEIEIFPYTFCPTGWVRANGALLSIQQNAALFSLLGTNYGGNGTSTFALPNWGPIYSANGYPLITCIAITGIYPSQN